MRFILGTKLGMTQVFDEKGNLTPVSIIEAGPCTVVQIRTKDKDKYEAVQIGSGFKKKLNKPLSGHVKKLGNFKYIQEFRIKPRVKDRGDYKTGDKITVEMFKFGEPVNVQGISKGKGFQGVVKRHGFHGGPKSHGQKHRLRAPGSIGWTALQRVAKGRKMAGRMGGDFVTVKNLKIAKVDQENNLIFIKGAVPGNLGGLFKIFL